MRKLTLTNNTLHLLNLVFTKNTVQRFTPIEIQSVARYYNAAPFSWRRSIFGSTFYSPKYDFFKQLLKLVWAQPEIKNTKIDPRTWYGSTMSVTFSRGPMARKKQSREQLQSFALYSSVSLTEIPCYLTSEQRFQLNLLNPTVVCLAITHYPFFLQNITTNLFCATRFLTKRTVWLWSLGRVGKFI